MQKQIDKVYILGNGNQSPYGINEIMDIIPLSHWRKIQKICSKYHNAPTLRLNAKDGVKLTWSIDRDSQQVNGLETDKNL